MTDCKQLLSSLTQGKNKTSRHKEDFLLFSNMTIHKLIFKVKKSRLPSNPPKLGFQLLWPRRTSWSSIILSVCRYQHSRIQLQTSYNLIANTKRYQKLEKLKHFSRTVWCRSKKINVKSEQIATEVNFLRLKNTSFLSFMN